MDKLKTANYPLLGFLAFTSRILILGPTWPDAAALLIFASLYGFNSFIKARYQEEIPLNEEVKKEIESLKASLSAFKIGIAQRR